MKILFFDTETTGLINNWKAEVEKEAWDYPRILELYACLTNEEGEIIRELDTLVVSDVECSEKAFQVHGITKEQTEREGISQMQMLIKFCAMVTECDLMVCHNYGFDSRLVYASAFRNRFGHIIRHMDTKPSRCTKEAGTDFCQIQTKYGLKWPRLEELYEKLFNKVLVQEHRAKSDVMATIACFFELQKKGFIQFDLRPEESEK